MRPVLLGIAVLFLSVRTFSQVLYPEMVIQKGLVMSMTAGFGKFQLSAREDYLLYYNEIGHFKIYDLAYKRLLRDITIKPEATKTQNTLSVYNYGQPSLSDDAGLLLTEMPENRWGFSVWNTSTGFSQLNLRENSFGQAVKFSHARFTPDNKLLTHGLNQKTGQFEFSILGINSNTYRIFNYDVPIVVGKKKKPANLFRERGTTAIAINARQDLVAMGMDDGRLYLFDIKNLKERKPVILNPDMEMFADTVKIDQLCFSPDNKFLTSASGRSVRVWNLQTGKMLREYIYPGYLMEGYRSANYYGTISPNCGCVVTHDANGGPFEFRDVLTGKLLRSLQYDYNKGVESVFFDVNNDYVSDDGKRMVRGPGGVFDFVDLDQPAARQHDDRMYTNETSAVTTMLFDSVSRELYLARPFNDAVIFNLATGQAGFLRNWPYASDTVIGREFEFHNQEFGSERNLYISPDRKYIFTFDAGAPHIIEPGAVVWDREKKTVVERFESIQRYVDKPDTILGEKGARKWIGVFSDISSPVYLLHAPYRESERDKDGNLISITPLEVYDSKTRKRIRVIYPFGIKQPGIEFNNQVSSIPDIPLAADGKSCYVGMNDGSVAQIDLRDGREIKIYRDNTNEGMQPGDYNPVQQLILSADKKFIYAAINDRTRKWYVVMYDVRTGQVVRKSGTHDSPISTILPVPAARLLITAGKDQQTKFWDLQTGKLRATMVLKEHDFVITTPDGYYMATKKGAAMLHFVLGRKIYLFEQFDLQLNRPDIVMERIGMASATTIANYRRAYEKRVTLAGFNPVDFETQARLNAPVTMVSKRPAGTKTDAPRLSLQLEAEDRQFAIHKLQVRVNGVPVFGLAGIDKSTLKSRKVSEEITLELSAGVNIIELSAFNEKGIESPREVIRMEYNAPASKPNLYLVSIGASKYVRSEMNLDYAAKDAGDVARLFASQTDRYGEIKQMLLQDKDVTRAALMELGEKLKNSKVDDQLIVFYAGHGLFDKSTNYYLSTYDIDFLNPSKGGILFSDIEKMLESIPARQKIVLLDACHSGEVDKTEKNFVRSQKAEFGEQKMRAVGSGSPGSPNIGLSNSFELMKQSFADVTFRTGATMISAARGGEFALESSRWKNGVFTFCLLKGLSDKSADRNRDGIILVSELQRYLQDMVSQQTGGKQQPTSRSENLVSDFRVW